MEIRLLQRADYSGVREIYKAVGLDLDVSQLDFYAATYSSFVAVASGKLVGVLLAQPLQWINEFNKVLWLEYIAVDAAHRGRGVGLALISAAKDLAQKHGIKRLFTNLNIDNEESKSLLLKAEFDVKDWRIASFPAND